MGNCPSTLRLLDRSVDIITERPAVTTAKIQLDWVHWGLGRKAAPCSGSSANRKWKRLSLERFHNICRNSSAAKALT